MMRKTEDEIKQLIKGFIRGLKLQAEAEALMSGLDSVTYEITSLEPAMVKIECDGWIYRIKAEDLVEKQNPEIENSKKQNSKKRKLKREIGKIGIKDKD